MLRNAGQRHEIAAVAGLGELGDASGAADREKPEGSVGVRLDHADDAIAFEDVVDHGEVARLENIQRQLSARQQQSLGERKDRKCRWQRIRVAIGQVQADMRVAEPCQRLRRCGRSSR